MGIELLFKPMNISGTNVDDRYFTKNADGTYTPTATFVHNVLRDATNFYKNRVFDLDTDCTYHTEKLGEFKDTWTIKLNEEQRRLKYGDKLKELDKRKREWREANADKCYTRAGGPDLGDIDELRFFSGYSPDCKPSLQQSVAMYKALKEYTKEHDAEIKQEIAQKPEVLMVDKKYEAEYKTLCDKWAEELGIPVETKKIGEITRTKYTIKGTNTKVMKDVASDDSILDEYVTGLVEYLTNTDKAEFKKARQEMITLIDNDFITNFNDSSKYLKAQSEVVSVGTSEVVKGIDIYTKADESDNAEKIITISKEDASDNAYKYIFNINTDDGDLKVTYDVTTKAQLRKALTTTKVMIENVDSFKKYVEDIDKCIESL